MRYNKHELFALASQTSQNFDREGVLILKERQDSFFRRSEGYSVRWFRLRGNLLFYLKGPEPWYEPLGVIVLGNHQVSVQTQDENGHWPFQIVWENGVCYRMATYLESERTLWLKAMAVAPYEHMTQRIADLHRQLNDTRSMVDLRMFRVTNKIINDFNEVPLCELSLSCDNLLCDANGNPPSAFAAAFVLFPERDICVRYCCTETVERCSNPCFSRTMMFRGSDGISSDSLIRIVVYDMRESVSQTGVSMGSVTMRLSHIQEAQRLRVPLLTMDDRTVGFVTLNGWSLEPSHAGASPTHPNTERNSIDLTPKVLSHRRSQSLPPRLGLKLKYPSYGMLIRLNFVNPHQATYRFHSGLGGDITVHEAIAEPRFCYTMPLQLVEIYMNREKELLESMLAFADITNRLPHHQLQFIPSNQCVSRLFESAKKAQELFNTHLSVMKLYQTAKNAMLKRPNVFYKPSSEKEEPDLGFVPINLHLQRMWVHNDTLNKTGFHDIVTAGAFTAHSHRADKPGGLIRLVQQSKDISTQKAEMMANTNLLDAEFENLHAMKAIRNISVTNLDRCLLLVQAYKFVDAQDAMEVVKSHVYKLIALWNDVQCAQALTNIGWNKKRIDEESEAIKLAEKLDKQARLADAPEGAAGADYPEGAAGLQVVPCIDGIPGSSPLKATSPMVIEAQRLAATIINAIPVITELTPEISAALEAALAASAAGSTQSAVATLTALTQSAASPLSEPASSSSSSIDTTPTADIACALSASVPDMQARGNELQFHNDYFKSDADDSGPRSENSGKNGGKNNRGKNNRGGKNNWGGKNNRSGKCNRNNVNSGNELRNANESNSNMVELPLPSFERHGSLRTEFKCSASLEQVCYKSLVNSKKADKKKGKKNKRDWDRSSPQFTVDPEIGEYNLKFFKLVTKALEDMLFNVIVSVNEIIEQGTYTIAQFNDTKILMDLLIKLMDESHKWTRMALTALRIESETPAWTFEHATLRSRRDICFSQALTTVTAGLLCWLTSKPGELVAKVIQSGLGPLCGFEGLLTLYALEKTMWGDMVVAIEDLHAVLFKLVKITSSTPLIPQVTGYRNAMIVELPVSESLYARFDQCTARTIFTLTAVFFNIGINEKATVAEAIGESKPQYYSNNDNLERLNKYYQRYTKIFPNDPMEPLRASSRSKPLEEVMENLRAAVPKSTSKNVEVLQLASLATRLMHGVRFTSCKSAKDRTGMSVTLEQTNILSSEYHLADHDRKRALDTMRSDGCRRENTAKNIGVSRFAFTKKQVMSLPQEYRPPHGSYGSTLT